MKVFLKKNVEKIGMAGEIIVVGDGYGRNFLIPKGLGEEITEANAAAYVHKKKVIENRKEVIATQTSMLAEKIKGIKLTIKKKMHDDGKLYGAINASELVPLLEKEGVKISKNQIIFDKSAIKGKGTYEFEVKLSSRLRPSFRVAVVPE